MQLVTQETIAKIADLAASELTPEQVEAAAYQLVGDPAIAQRVIEWLPEAFGFVLIGHMGEGITLPSTFKAKNSTGCWIEIPFSKEPIFGQAIQLATSMYHNGPREVFKNLALRSSVAVVVNKALNAGASLNGASLSPPAMLSIAAESYSGIA